MIVPGLVSVSFRKKTPLEICSLCEKAALRAVEWGGDVHVPPRSPVSSEVRRMSADHGLTISSYGSYYRVMQPLDELKACLDTARGLGCGVVRIWCGSKGSVEAEGERRQIVDELIRCAETAKQWGIMLALEYHGRTLTDERESAVRLMKETEPVSDSLSFYWQPRWDWGEEKRLASLEDVRSRLSHLHVFTWKHEGGEVIRLPLEDGGEMWKKVLGSFGEDRYALLEFVQDDSDEALLRDAAVLNRWINR